MEWFLPFRPALPEEAIRDICTLSNLPSLCTDVYEVAEIEPCGKKGVISCVWGLFQIETQPIRNGIRYALTSCPNALQWTITSRNGETTLHCSINQTTPDPDFAQSIVDFIAHLHRGLQQLDSMNPAPSTPA